MKGKETWVDGDGKGWETVTKTDRKQKFKVTVVLKIKGFVKFVCKLPPWCDFGCSIPQSRVERFPRQVHRRSGTVRGSLRSRWAISPSLCSRRCLGRQVILVRVHTYSGRLVNTY